MAVTIPDHSFTCVRAVRSLGIASATALMNFSSLQRQPPFGCSSGTLLTVALRKGPSMRSNRSRRTVRVRAWAQAATSPDIHAASPATGPLVTATVPLPTGFCTRFPTFIMTASTRKGGPKRVVAQPRAAATTHSSGNVLLTTFRRDELQAKVFVHPIRTCDDHLVWLSFTIEPIDEDSFGPLTFERHDTRAIRLLVRDVENLLSDIDDEVDLYGRTVDDVVADIRKAGIVSR